MVLWAKIAAVMVLGSSLSQADPLAPLATQPRLVAPAPIARPAVTGFAAYKLHLAQRARREGVREATIAATVPALAYNARVIALDRAQPGGVNNPNAYPPFAPIAGNTSTHR